MSAQVPFWLGAMGDPDQQYTEIKHGGIWYPFPVAADSLIIKQPESPFSPAIQRGTPQKVYDQRMNVEVWDDFTGGQGEVREDVNESITNFYTSTLDTRRKGYLTLPSKLTLVQNLGRSYTNGYPLFVTAVMDNSLNTNLMVWGYASLGMTRRSSAGVLTQIGNGANPWSIYDMVSFKGALYISQANTTDGYCIKKSSDFGVTWANIAAGATTDCKGLCEHDGKLFTYDQTNKVIKSSTDGTTWNTLAGSQGAYTMETGESITQLYEWNTPSGQGSTIFMITSKRHLILEEEVGVWHTFYDYDEVIAADEARAHVWRRNQFVYVTFHQYQGVDPNGMVLVHNGGTTDEVGPRVKGGLPEDWFHHLSHVQGNVHELFGWGLGGTVNGIFSYGNVMSMSELGGWHTVMAGSKMSNGTSYVVGGGYSKQVAYAVMSNGDLYSAPMPDRRFVHPITLPNYYDSNQHTFYKSWTTNGLDNIWKIGAYFLIDTQLADGTNGIPTGSNVTLCYRTDVNPTWFCLPLLGATDSAPVGLLTDLSLKPSTLAWPIIMPLPDGVTQQGVPYKRLQWRVSEQCTPGGLSPVITQVALYYTLWLEQFYSHSFNIDLTEETFRKFPGHKLAGYDREFLQAKIEEISQTKGYAQFRFSMLPWQDPVVATDMLLTHRVNANDGGAVIGVALRDLTAPKV